MKHLFLTFTIFLLLPAFLFSQSKSKKIKKVVNGATAINFYPSQDPVIFFNDYYINENSLELRFITANTGTFRITNGDSLYIEREEKLHMHSQRLGISGSIQFVKNDRLFHEFSLTRLTSSKGSLIEKYIATDTLGNKRFIFRGFEEKSFTIGMRYELGTYFGKNKKAKVRFGLSGGIEPTYFRYKRIPSSSQEFPIGARLFTVEAAVIPMLSVKLSKKIILDMKVIPNILMADFGKITKKDPTLPKVGQSIPRKYDLPEVNTTISLVLRYNFKETKR